MKIHLLCLLYFLSVSFVKAQEDDNTQKKIGFLFANLPLFYSYELLQHQIQLRKDEFKDTSTGDNQNFKTVIIKDISAYRLIAPQTNQVLLVIFKTPFEKEGVQGKDTAMGIRILIHLQPGISKKEAKKNYKKISTILEASFTYANTVYVGKKLIQTIMYSNKKFDVYPPLQSSFGLQKEDNVYFINLYFANIKNG